MSVLAHSKLLYLVLTQSRELILEKNLFRDANDNILLVSLIAVVQRVK